MAQGNNSSATANNHPSNAASENPPGSILSVAYELSRYKGRSLDTARRHLQLMEERGDEVIVGLLGDSLIERMTTTGQSESLQSWPSETMLLDSTLTAMNDARLDTDAPPIARMEGVANFGCGGDKIENILYRILGDPSKGLKGLARELHPLEEGITTRRSQRLWVIRAGSNNLHHKKGLRDNDLHTLDILLRTLHYLSCPGTTFLLTGLSYRTDVPNDLVDKANAELQRLVVKLQQEFTDAPQLTEQSHGGKGEAPTYCKKSDSTASGVDLTAQPHTFEFLPAPQFDESGEWLEDHVHLTQEGYRIWMQTLLPKVHQMLRRPLSPPDKPKPRIPTSADEDDESFLPD